METCRECGCDCNFYFMNYGYCPDCHDSKFNECDECGKTISKSKNICNDCK